MTSAAGALDEAVKEYLVYRGFTSTLKQFELEKRDDKDKGFRVRWVCSCNDYDWPLFVIGESHRGLYSTVR